MFNSPRPPAADRRRKVRPAFAALLALVLGATACGAGSDPTLATLDSTGIATELSSVPRTSVIASSPAVRGDTVGVIVSSGLVVEGQRRLSMSFDAGATWKDATVDGAQGTDIALEVLVAGPSGWLALGRPRTGAKDRLVALTSSDGRAFAQSGDGIEVPSGASYLAAGTTSGWTVVFRKDGAPWQVATSVDGATWTAVAAETSGISTSDKLSLRSLASSGRELLLVGRADLSDAGSESVVLRSQDGGQAWTRDRTNPAGDAAPNSNGLRAATWTPQGFAAIGWGWTKERSKAPYATFLSPQRSDRFTATLEKGLRDGTRTDQGADELDESGGVYLVAGNDGDLPSVRQQLRIGVPGTWKDVHLPDAPKTTHRFAQGNVPVPGGFLVFQHAVREVSSETEVYFVAPDGTATLRSTFGATAPGMSTAISFAQTSSGIEALGYVQSQPAIFYRTGERTFSQPTVMPTDQPVEFTGLRASGGARLLLGQRQLANHGHGVAWTSTDGSGWEPGSEAVLTPVATDSTWISDGLVSQGRFFVAGQVTDRIKGVTSGAVAVRTSGEAFWRQISPEVFAGAEKSAVTVRQLAEGADGSIVAVGTATESGKASLRIWRSADGTAFTPVALPVDLFPADSAPSELIRVGDRLVLSLGQELPDRRHRAVVYESTDNGATWAPAHQDPVESDAPVSTDLAADHEDAVLIASAGAPSAARIVALRRAPDGAWRTLTLESKALEGGHLRVIDAALADNKLILSLEHTAAGDARSSVVEVKLPR